MTTLQPRLTKAQEEFLDEMGYSSYQEYLDEMNYEELMAANRHDPDPN
jgi:hypothetical protein